MIESPGEFRLRGSVAAARPKWRRCRRSWVEAVDTVETVETVEAVETVETEEAVESVSCRPAIFRPGQHGSGKADGRPRRDGESAENGPEGTESATHQG